MFKYVTNLSYNDIEMKERNYPKSLCVSKKIWEQIKREKPKGIVFNTYIKILIDHSHTCSMLKIQIERLE